MPPRSLFLCLLTAALCTVSAPAQDETKPRADKSGQLEKRRQEMLKRFDANGDGKLDDPEKAAMKEAMKQEKAVRGSGDIGSLGAGAAGEPATGGGGLQVRELIKRFDRDGDGKLDEAELGDALKARAEFMQKNGGAAGAGPVGGQVRRQILRMFDKNGDGRLDDEERAAAEKFRGEQVKRYDRNGNGQLDPDERAEAMKAFASDHPELMPQSN